MTNGTIIIEHIYQNYNYRYVRYFQKFDGTGTISK